jgi:hypothetical protein
MLPRFTLRAILAVTTALAIFFVIVGAGTRGQDWAWGATIGIASVAVSMLIQAALFAMVWCFARLSTTRAISSEAVPTRGEREAES